MRRILLSLAALVVSAGTALALNPLGTPIMGVEQTGGCRAFTIRDLTNRVDVPVGCVDTSAHLYVPNILNPAGVMFGSSNAKTVNNSYYPDTAALPMIPFAGPAGYIQGDHFYTGTLINAKGTRGCDAQEIALTVHMAIGPVPDHGGSPNNGNFNCGKTGINYGVNVASAGVDAWGMAGGVRTESGAGPGTYVGLEVDGNFNHLNAGVGSGNGNAFGIFITGIAETTGTAAIYGASGGTGVTGGHNHYDIGILFQDTAGSDGNGNTWTNRFAKTTAFWDNTSAVSSFKSSNNHSGAAFLSEGTGGYALRTTGVYSSPAVSVAGTAPVGVQVAGTFSLAAIDLAPTTGTARAINMNDDQIIRWGSYDMVSSGGNMYFRNSSGIPILQSNSPGDISVGRHFRSQQSGSPGLSGCGTSPTKSTGMNDTHGTVTIGSGGTGCTITFAGAYGNTPDCIVMPTNGGAPLSLVSIATNALTFTASGTPAGQKYVYHCMGQ